MMWVNRIPDVGRVLRPENPIFITFPIDQHFSFMSSNLINRTIQHIWKMGPIQKAITATKIRKSTATHMRI